MASTMKLAGTRQTSFRIRPDSAAGPPTAGAWESGTEYVDANGARWVCIADGTPGTWIRQGTEYQLSVGGFLSGETLPLTDLGIETIYDTGTLRAIRAIRRIAGSSGTTTIELEVDGVATGVTLSWTGGVDANDAEKTSTISLAVTAGQRLTFRVTSVEAGDPADVIVRVR